MFCRPLLSKLMSRLQVDRLMQLVEARGFIRGASEVKEMLTNMSQNVAQQAR